MEYAAPGFRIELPEALELPTCDTCRDYSVPDAMEAAVAAAVQGRLPEAQRAFIAKHVDTLCTKHKVSKRQVAVALGVTPSYLSNIAAGAKLASPTLLRLLRAYGGAPAEFLAAVRGEALDARISTRNTADEAVSIVVVQRGTTVRKLVVSTTKAPQEPLTQLVAPRPRAGTIPLSFEN